MKYFYDTEFLEGTQKKWFGNTKPTIDLISIGIVSEDNREYYAISKDFNLKEAWNRHEDKIEIMSGDARNFFPNGRKYKEYWIRENVLRPIYYEMIGKDINFHDYDKNFSYSNLKRLINLKGKTNKEIADEIKLFTMQYSENKNEIWDNPKFYGYYSAYDHVALCWLFGKMIDLPKGFPMYTIDLKQALDEKYPNGIYKLSNEIDGRTEILVKNHFLYPQQTNQHNALNNAKFNFNLYKFLKSL